ncbi:hypothetical protein D3C86_1816940 [compost metagenome]
MLVFPGVLVQVFQQLFGFSDPLALPQSIRRAVLQAYPGGHAQRAQGHPRGTEHFRMAAGIAVEHVAVGGHQLQAADMRRIRLKVFAGAVGRGRDRAGKGLVIDVSHVLQGLADVLERRAHA